MQHVWCPYKTGKFRHSTKGKRNLKKKHTKARDWSDASISQVMPKIARKPLEFGIEM